MKILEQTTDYVLIGNKAGENLSIYDEEVQAIGGSAFSVGDICADPVAEEAHEARKAVLSEWGFDVDTPVEIIVILNTSLAVEIGNEINEKLRVIKA